MVRPETSPSPGPEGPRNSAARTRCFDLAWRCCSCRCHARLGGPSPSPNTTQRGLLVAEGVLASRRSPEAKTSILCRSRCSSVSGRRCATSNLTVRYSLVASSTSALTFAATRPHSCREMAPAHLSTRWPQPCTHAGLAVRGLVPGTTATRSHSLSRVVACVVASRRAWAPRCTTST